MRAIPYLSFNGNCLEAVNFYHSVLGGKLEILKYRDMPSQEGTEVSGAWKDKVMHSSLVFEDGTSLYFSDAWEGAAVKAGENVTVHLQVESEDDARRIFQGLGVDATITMPLDKTFWNSLYGSLVDQFGIPWGIEYELK